MTLIQVTGRKTEKEFIKVPKILYRKDLNWVCPMDSEIRSRFNPDHNPHMRDGEAIRWVLKDDKGKLIGRLAAFYSREKAGADKVPSGGMGLFECIDDEKAAFLLFDAAGNWLRSKGMKAMDAPVNFGENDNNWGLLVEGFTHPGFGMPYNFPYYRKFFEDYGFSIYFRQYSYHLDLTRTFPERFWKIAEWIGKKPDFHFRPFAYRDAEKFIADMVQIYNEAWKDFKENFTPLKLQDVREGMMKAKPILDPDLIWFAYYKDEPIGFFIMFPDINQILKKLDGRMHILNMIRFLYYKNTGTINRIRAQIAGVVPRFQNSGVESGIFWHLNEKMKHKSQYGEIELSWVGDFNPKMIALYEAVGATKAKTHHTYRYMLDPEIPFERFMPGKAGNTISRKNKTADIR